jgi:diacylglycerol kinase family enzyme
MTYILYNPLATRVHGDIGVKDVAEALREERPEVLDITALDTGAFFAARSPEDEIVLCGGDGTIHRLVNDLGGQAPAVPVYIWRFGSGNDFLRDTAAAGESRILLNDYMNNLRTAAVQGKEHRFLNGCSCGVDAVVCGMMEENRLAPKKSGYAITALRSFFNKYKPMSGRVTVDGVTREYDRIWMACAMNGHYQGGGMKFAPHQDRTGDTLTCMVWHDTGALGTLVRFPFAIPGKHTGFSACDMRVGREIVVELDAPTMLQMDGEVMDGVTGYIARK